MRKTSPLPYILLTTLLIALLSLSKETSENIRGMAASIVSPLWQIASEGRMAASGIWEGIGGKRMPTAQRELLEKLTLENRLLRAELAALKEIIRDTGSLIPKTSEIIPARVIYRTSSTWNHFLWINVGEEQRRIGKNSPVIVGTSIVGVIDYVGKKQSRVRLITDSSLCPSVRAVRKGKDSSLMLAKGELRGSAEQGWTSSPVLQGIGFNYDFEDEYGPGRDLRTGVPLKGKGEAIPILKVKDRLVTTGMDGIFPEGLDVAVVTKVHPLKEGDYFYELEARPSADSIDDLKIVFVAPPLGFEPMD
jgi:cell shape-determining protein MreC